EDDLRIRDDFTAVDAELCRGEIDRVIAEALTQKRVRDERSPVHLKDVHVEDAVRRSSARAHLALKADHLPARHATMRCGCMSPCVNLLLEVAHAGACTSHREHDFRGVLKARSAADAC